MQTNNIIKILRLIIALIIILLVIFALFKIIGFFSPKTKIGLNQTAVVTQMRDLNRLETADFTIQKIIEAGNDGNAFQNILFGDKILLIAQAEVIAGFDLSKLPTKNIEVKGDSLSITLPAPEILITKLDNEQTKVYDRKQGILSQGDKDLESKARLSAEQSIREAACAQGILDTASTNARTQLQTTFQTAGFKEVSVYIPQATCK